MGFHLDPLSGWRGKFTYFPLSTFPLFFFSFSISISLSSSITHFVSNTNFLAQFNLIEKIGPYINYNCLELGQFQLWNDQKRKGRCQKC